jgi:tetratricopeptide (TPR) repeat protein
MARRRWGRRSVAESVALPHPIRWTLTTAVLLLLAVAVFLLGPYTDAKQPLPEPVATIAPWLRDPIGPAVGGIMVLLGALALRRALYARLARKPGPVHIVAFSEPQASGKKSRSFVLTDVLADFQRTLREMRLATPQSVPTDPQADTILNDVQTSLDSPGNAVATAAALLGAFFRIRHAYRVSAQLRQRSGDEPYGITVHVVMLPTGAGGEIHTVWAADWTSAAERAAHVVGAFILPRSRLARKPPWTAWRGLDLPHELFHHSQTARRYVKERRYEEAIDEYHRALKLDPQNSYLRIELAQTQEQLGLEIDAVTGYADVIALESWYDPRLWRRLRRLLADNTTGHPPSKWRTRSPNGRNALLIARYRLVARLVSAQTTADQWIRSLKSGDHCNVRRAAERAARRERLTVWLRSYFREYLRAHGQDVSGDDVERCFTEVTRSEAGLRHLIRYVGYCETQHLIEDYKWTRGRRHPGLPVTQTAISVMAVWAPIRLVAAARDPELPVDVRKWTAGANRRTDEWWPPKAEWIDGQLRRIMRRKPRRLHEWQEHYNCACAFSVAIAATADERERDRLALSAIRHLEHAVAASDSSFVGTYAQWLATGDEDLSELRSTRWFKDFLDRYLPNEASRELRPRPLLILILSRHSLVLLQRYASMRMATSGADVPGDDERRARNVVASFLQNDRDWRTRLALIREGQSLSRRLGVEKFRSPLPSFQDDDAAREISEKLRPDEGIEFADEYEAEVKSVILHRERSMADLAPTEADSNGEYWHRLHDRIHEILTWTP